jgi:hypothetical protein
MNRKTREIQCISEQELIAQTTNKYHLRFWQSQGFFVPESPGMYDQRWVQVWIESRHYMKAGFGEWEALSEAMRDLFGYGPNPF